jgi:hypothetical protein
MKAEVLLPMTLQLAVPMEIRELQQLDADQFEATRKAWAENAKPGDLAGAFSEAVLYRIEGETAPAFAHLARALAALAFAPGGVRFAGLHFEATHHRSQEQAA